MTTLSLIVGIAGGFLLWVAWENYAPERARLAHKIAHAWGCPTCGMWRARA